VVSIYLAGEACGAITQILIGDRLGRIRFLQFMSIVATIGTTIQTASVNIGMFLFGRWAAGYAVGLVDFPRPRAAEQHKTNSSHPGLWLEPYQSIFLRLALLKLVV
jgi:hypothetical protein